ncbi:TPA: hypothetical protein ACPTW9_001499, partial [Klebsiella variicola]
MAELNPPLGTTTPEIFLDNVKRADELVNGPAGTVNDRGGEPLDTWRQMMAKNDEIRQNIIPLSKQYMTLAAAQADIANIPEGSATYVRSSDGITLADEYINNSGVLVATGRVMISKGYIDYLASRGLIPAELDSELEYSEVKYDPVSGRMSEFSLSDGRVFIPLLQLADRSVGSMQLEDNAVTSDKLSSDLNNVIPRNLDPDTGYSDVSYDPVTNKMSTYTMTDGRVFIPLLQI